MSDGTFTILSKGRTIFRDGEDKIQEVTKRGRRSAKTNTEIKFPIFKEAAKYIDDDLFWTRILEDASRGVFQKPYRYNEGTLSFKIKSVVHSKEICQDDPVLCLKNIQEFMQSNGCYSEKDHEMKLLEIEQQRNEASQTILDWKSIRPKNRKLLISRYVAYLGEHYNLNKLELSQLINLSRLAYSVGLINSTTVIMENNVIADIEILCYDKRTRDFFIDPDAKIPKASKSSRKINDDDENGDEIFEVKTSNVPISKSRNTDWIKFINVLSKRIAAHNKLDELAKS